MSYLKTRIVFAGYALVGAVIITTSILHASYTTVIPVLNQLAFILLFIPAFFLGIICIEFKDTIIVMLATMFLSILLLALTRSAPAFFGIITGTAPFFIISQFALTVPLFFPLVLVFTLGTVAGLLFNEFIIEPRTDDLI
ncbi:MAG: hypothetical protein ACFFBR_02415 [Promethearchaeota archaeon]